MSLDKKAILKEIEVLIRSIKVHYDNIEHEYRIPTIELELITAKIRKLHEKSIVYNHLHYIEEEQLQNSKRIKFDQMVMRQAAENNMPNEIVVESQQNEMFATQLKFEEKMASIEKESHLKRFDGYCIGFIVHFKNWHTALVSAPTLPYNYKVINKRPNGNPLSHWYRTS